MKPLTARVSSAPLAILLASCAASTARPAAAPEAKAAAPAAPLSEAERGAHLDAACGDHARFRALVLDDTKPSPTELERVARLYIDRCGLTEMVELASKLIEFPTVSVREHASTGESFKGMAAFLGAFAQESGLELRVVGDHDAWELAYGHGAPSTAFVMHGDVVPIDDGVDAPDGGRLSATMDAVTGEPLPPGWTKAPFRGTVSHGKLYGRGSEDDKGPIAAVLVVMRTMAKLGLEPRGRILAVIGTGEENDWSGMKRYAEASPKPRNVVSIDANFPVVVAESGFVAWQLAVPMKPAGSAKVERAGKKCTTAVDAQAGQFLTQVPGDARMTLAPSTSEKPERLLARLRELGDALNQETRGKYRVSVEADGPRAKVTVYGEAVHSSVAEEGHNALWGLAQLGSRIGLCANGVSKMLRVVNDHMVGDHFGERLGLAYTHETMGRLLISPTLLRVDAESVKLSINMRRPAGMTSDQFGKKLDGALRLLKEKVDSSITEVPERYVGEPAVAETDGPLVPTLLDIYRKETGDEGAKPISIRGGTYARLFPGAVSFGPSLPGHPYRGHAPDEYIELDALTLLGRAVFSAILLLDAQNIPVASSTRSRRPR